MFLVKWLLNDGQKWEINVLAHMVFQGGCFEQFWFILFLFPSYQIACLDFVSPFGDKLT